MNQNNFFLITGGPGSGKSSLIDLLRHNGYKTVTEAARLVLQEQNRLGRKDMQFNDRFFFVNCY